MVIKHPSLSVKLIGLCQSAINQISKSLSWKRLITKCVQVSTNYRVRKRFVRFFCKYLQNDLQGKEKKSWNHMFISQEQSIWKLSNKSRHHNCEHTTYVLLVTLVYIMHTKLPLAKSQEFLRKICNKTVTSIFYEQMNGCGKYPLKWLMDLYKYNLKYQ